MRVYHSLSLLAVLALLFSVNSCTTESAPASGVVIDTSYLHTFQKIKITFTGLAEYKSGAFSNSDTEAIVPFFDDLSKNLITWSGNKFLFHASSRSHGYTGNFGQFPYDDSLFIDVQGEVNLSEKLVLGSVIYYQYKSYDSPTGSGWDYTDQKLSYQRIPLSINSQDTLEYRLNGALSANIPLAVDYHEDNQIGIRKLVKVLWDLPNSPMLTIKFYK